MPKHPTVNVPNIGPMDHAWDLLGEWETTFEAIDGSAAVPATLVFDSWAGGHARLEPDAACSAGLPERFAFTRTSDVHLTEAGGGALQWALAAPQPTWSIQAMLWPGALHLFVYHGEDDERELYRARAGRTGEYYRAKYPVTS